ncbi:(deoxy)nucleoside triphosphate pyrophosphohydrolase [Arsenicicoccus dermatophilus]|uniref:(deoxy)nucleoside triphosphate pyrophosphohydrolase n=1 Tax=Arsenicicoccus dermatophilus TaxID=1076331 RepID=UPI001F4CA149|nr:(deoxy)nucleoside triphosphate pyrophosphohydrolase [Arsenicicoccus dermatophilus]MCH8613690.1 (deoxy)nucleoside triphosphate pyrophosphohydrolase [Arsenicicoccus dermatophilus]
MSEDPAAPPAAAPPAAAPPAAAPPASPAPDRPVAVVGAALLDDLDTPTTLLAARRTAPPALAGGWELPGGKVDPGESELDALHRELREELGVEIEVGEEVTGPRPDGRWDLSPRHAIRVWTARVTEGRPQPLEDHDDLRVLRAPELDTVAWLPADAPIVAAVAALLRP